MSLMHCVSLTENGKEKTVLASDGEKLKDVLLREKIATDHPCGGMGKCGKCKVTVNGEEVLSCQYEIHADITAEIKKNQAIATNAVTDETGCAAKNMCFCLDVGTTTLVLALVNRDEKKVIRTVTENNPQRAFAADVISRIEFSEKNAVEVLRKVLTDVICKMIDDIANEFETPKIQNLYVVGNTVMLHILFGEDPSGMGRAPYEAVFLTERMMTGREIGTDKVEKIISMCSIAPFVGADITAGLNYVGRAKCGKYNFLVDLGTNAEIVLYGENVCYATSAAAGPCFEGVNISMGMSATEGAIYSYTGRNVFTIGNVKPKGICATGLIDAIKVLLDGEFIDKSGFCEDGECEIAENVSINQEDVRKFQLAKAAIHSAMEALVKKAGIGYDAIDKLFVAGGFSSKMNMGNAFAVGLFPKKLVGKTVCVNNSALLGVIKYSCGEYDVRSILKNAEYVDLAGNEYFEKRFIENMTF